MCANNLLLLNVASARGLQHWAEKLNLPEIPDFCLLARSVVKLRERVKEHILFTKWDVIWGLGRVNQGLLVSGLKPTQLALEE